MSPPAASGPVFPASCGGCRPARGCIRRINRRKSVSIPPRCAKDERTPRRGRRACRRGKPGSPLHRKGPLSARFPADVQSERVDSQPSLRLHPERFTGRQRSAGPRSNRISLRPSSVYPRRRTARSGLRLLLRVTAACLPPRPEAKEETVQAKPLIPPDGLR